MSRVPRGSEPNLFRTCPASHRSSNYETACPMSQAMNLRPSLLLVAKHSQSNCMHHASCLPCMNFDIIQLHALCNRIIATALELFRRVVHITVSCPTLVGWRTDRSTALACCSIVIGLRVSYRTVHYSHEVSMRFPCVCHM